MIVLKGRNMSNGKLQSIIAFSEAWESAYRLLCKHINAFFKERNIKAKMRGLPIGRAGSHASVT